MTRAAGAVRGAVGHAGPRPRRPPPAGTGPAGRGTGRAAAGQEGRSRSAAVAVVAAAGLLAASLVLGACQWTAGDAGAKAAGPPTGEAPRVVSRPRCRSGASGTGPASRCCG